MTWAELTHLDDHAADVAPFHRVRTGEIDEYSFENRFVRKDGQRVQTDWGPAFCQQSVVHIEFPHPAVAIQPAAR